MCLVIKYSTRVLYGAVTMPENRRSPQVLVVLLDGTGRLVAKALRRSPLQHRLPLIQFERKGVHVRALQHVAQAVTHLLEMVV